MCMSLQLLQLHEVVCFCTSNSRYIDNYADYTVADFVQHNKFINTFPTSLSTPTHRFLTFMLQYEDKS